MTRPAPRYGPFNDGLAELRALIAAHHPPEQHGPSAFAALPTTGLPDPLTADPVLPIRPGLSLEPMPDPRLAEPAAPEPPVTTGFDPPADDVMRIVAAAQAGDSAAFGELYDRYVDLVYRYIYYRVGTKTLTEDLVSETFLRALRRITSFTWQGRDFAAWLVTIARNLIADHFKSGRYRLEVATADMLEADRVQDGPEGEVLDMMTNERLLEAVKQLNPEQQECVVLRFLQGMSVTETALAMSKTEGAIKALQYRAVRSLARLLPREMVW